MPRAIISHPVCLPFAWCEGLPDQAVLSKLCSLSGIPLSGASPRMTGGFGQIDLSIPKYANMAKNGTPAIVLRDLDKFSSACEYMAKMVWKKQGHMQGLLVFRLAVRETESWLIADSAGIAAFLGIPPAKVPSDPDAIADPKQLVINLARKSKRREIREGLVPIDQSAKEGPEYASMVAGFVTEKWNPSIAAGQSQSLTRCIRALAQLASVLHQARLI